MIEKIYVPQKTKQAQIFEGDAKTAAAKLVEKLKFEVRVHMSGVLVILEQQGGKWHRMSWETLAAGQQFGATLNMPVEAAVVGRLPRWRRKPQRRSWRKFTRSSIRCSTDYTADGYSAAVEALIRKVNPTIVIFPHTYQVRDFAPKVATRFNQVLISDVISVHMDSRVSPVFVRLLFQGKLNGDVRGRAATARSLRRCKQVPGERIRLRPALRLSSRLLLRSKLRRFVRSRKLRSANRRARWI